VREEAEAQRVRAALGDAVGVLLAVHLLAFLDLGGRQVARGELLAEHLEGDALDDLEWVDDVAERLGHLAAVLVANHRVQVDVGEGQLVRELQ